MSRFDIYSGHGFRTATLKHKVGDDVTRQGLAYTPADMEKMTSRGLPVTSREMASQFYDGDDKSDFFVSSDRIRSNDINDLWEEREDIRQKAKAAYRSSRSKPKSE